MADEHGKGSDTHPLLTDLFSLTPSNKELVLISITGGNKSKMFCVRQESLASWMKMHAIESLARLLDTCSSVLLAPFSNGKEIDCGGGAQY